MARKTGSVDVAVIGGGPAGAAAARLLASWGRGVLLLTRPAPGPPLAESLTPSCVRLLERIGMRDAIDRAGFIRSTGHTVQWGTESRRVETFNDGALGWQVRRDALDRVLLREARLGGASVHAHANVRSVDQMPHGDSRVRYEERGQARSVMARWVIDCTGRAGLVARGRARAATGPRTTAIVGLWERRPDWALPDETHTLVESYPGGWAWSVPVSATRRQVTVMLDPARTALARGSRLRLTYREELAATAMIRDACVRARPVGGPWARDATSYESDRTARGRVLLAGDAASSVDPLSSYGVKKALASAWLAAVVVHSVRDDPSLEAPAIAYFAERARAMVLGVRRSFGVLAREAASAHSEGFWSDREGARGRVGAAAELIDSELSEPDVAALRLDPEVRAAFETIRARSSLRLVASSDLARAPRPVVEGNAMILKEHLIVAAFPSGIRFIRNVDLTVLLALTPRYDDVSRLFEAYQRATGPVPLADFLGALAVMLGKGIARLD